MTADQKTAIQHDAESAVYEGKTPNQSCPHPFSSEQGRYWTECYWAEWDRRYDHRPEIDNGVDWADRYERRAK